MDPAVAQWTRPLRHHVWTIMSGKGTGTTTDYTVNTVQCLHRVVGVSVNNGYAEVLAAFLAAAPQNHYAFLKIEQLPGSVRVQDSNCDGSLLKIPLDAANTFFSVATPIVSEYAAGLFVPEKLHVQLLDSTGAVIAPSDVLNNTFDLHLYTIEDNEMHSLDTAAMIANRHPQYTQFRH